MKKWVYLFLIPALVLASSPFFAVAKQDVRVREGTKGSSSILNFTSKQLPSKFKHAVDFGIVGNYSRANVAKLSAAINQHINAPGTRDSQRANRSTNNPVTCYLNPTTGLNVILTPSGQFISGARLSSAQINDILTKGFIAVPSVTCHFCCPKLRIF